MRQPAALDTVREKLQSKTEEVRVVALLHAAAHGSRATCLAADIARMFEDPSAAVQWHAMRTFMVVGEGAVDAVPVLVTQLKKGEPAMLVSRALVAVAKVGPAAASALEMVVQRWNVASGHERSNALDALVHVAPNDPGVRRALLEALYAEDYSVQSTAQRFMEGASASVLDAVIADARSKLGTGDATVRTAVAALLIGIAPKRADVVRELVASLLDRIGEPCVWPAVKAVSKLPRPLSSTLLDGVVRVAREDGEAAEAALELLAELGPNAVSAYSVIEAKLAEHSDGLPQGGPEGQSARIFSCAAGALVAVSPGSKEALPRLIKWLRRVPTLQWPSKKTPNWYTIGDVARATAVLDPGNTDVLDAIVVVAQASRQWIDEDASGVLDFERKTREVAQALGDPPALWGHLERLGIERVEDDSQSDADESEGKGSELPDFPPERPPLPPPHVEPLPEQVCQALADALSKAEEHAGVSAGADADGVAKAIDVTISRSHREGQPLPDDMTVALGALWGRAVAQATGWTWAYVVQGEAKYVCLVSKDHAYACAPLNFIKAQVDPKRETTALLLFNMIKAGKLPDSKAGKLLFLG